MLDYILLDYQRAYIFAVLAQVFVPCDETAFVYDVCSAALRASEHLLWKVILLFLLLYPLHVHHHPHSLFLASLLPWI